MNLYQITNEYLALQNFVEDCDDSEWIDEESFKMLADELHDKFENKCINICKVIKNLDMKIQAMKKYEDDMKKRRHSLIKKMSSLSKYLRDNMVLKDHESIYSDEVDISVKKSKMVEVYDIDLLRKEYITEVSEKKPLKLNIRKDLNNGVNVPGSRLKVEPHLKINNKVVNNGK